eukprot:363416-Rhodomonas_salina.1
MFALPMFAQRTSRLLTQAFAARVYLDSWLGSQTGSGTCRLSPAFPPPSPSCTWAFADRPVRDA